MSKRIPHNKKWERFFMEGYKIAYDYNQPAAKWLRWLTVVQGILFIGMFGLGYYENELNWFHYIELSAGTIFIFIGLFFHKQFLLNHSSAVLSEQGIRYTKKWNDEQAINWSHISALTFTSNALVLNFTNDSKQELKFPWLNYKERLKVKEQLQNYAEVKNIGYSYKF